MYSYKRELQRETKYPHRFEPLIRTGRCIIFLVAASCGSSCQIWSADWGSGKQTAIQTVYKCTKGTFKQPSKSAKEHQRVNLKLLFSRRVEVQNTTQANRQQELNWLLQDKLDKKMQTLTEESKAMRRPG